MIRALRFLKTTSLEERELAYRNWSWALVLVAGVFVGAWFLTAGEANAADAAPRFRACGIEPASSLDQRLQSHFAGDN